MLHGRSAELVELDALLERVEQGRSGVLVLRGDPGVGKSALLNHLDDERTDRVCLRGRGVESEMDLPFAALHQLLRPIGARIASLPAPQRVALHAAFGLAESRAAEPFLVGVAVLTLLGEAAAGHGLVCIVEDAQWFDAASLGALLFASRRLDAEGVAVVYAVRTGTSDALEATDLPTLRLKALDTSSATDLLMERSPDIGDHVRTALLQRANGNPLALLEFLQSLSPGQLSGREPMVEPFAIDSGVERLFLERARQLPKDTQTMLLLAAAESSGNLAAVLDAAARRGITVESLGPAESAGLVHISGERLDFRHPLVRSAVYQNATTAAKLDAHRTLAMTMEAAGDQWEDRRAWHLASSCVAPDDNAADALDRSADRAIQRGGTSAASAALTRAAALTVDPESRGRRLLTAADLAWRAGHPEQATALLDSAEPLLMSPDLQSAAQFLRGLIELRSGMVDRSFGLLMASYHVAVAAGSDTALARLLAAGEAATFTGDRSQLLEIRAAAATAQPANRDDAIALGMLMEGAAMIAGVSSATPQMDKDLEDIRRLEGLADPQHLQWSARAALYLGDERTALSIYARAVGHARATSAIGALTPLLGRLSYCEFLSGRFTDAMTTATEALELAQATGQDQSYPLACMAVVEGARGDEQACREHANQVLALAVPRRSQIVAAVASWGLGLLELGLGKPQQALERLFGPDSHPHVAILRWSTPDVIEAAVRAGKPEVGRRALTGFCWAETSRLPGVLAAQAHCCAMLSEPTEAAQHYRRALELYAQSPRQYHSARAQLSLGETLRRQRSRTEARPVLRSAIGHFERLGSSSWADRAHAELRATGETATKREPGAVQTLTPQELRISRLAGEGLRNQEIAEQLFISSRTVEYHLHKVFNKLEISTRSDLVRIDFETP